MSPFDAALPSTEDLFSVIEAIHDNVAIVDHNGVMRWVKQLALSAITGSAATGSSAGPPMNWRRKKCFRHPWRPSSSKPAGWSR